MKKNNLYSKKLQNIKLLTLFLVIALGFGISSCKNNEIDLSSIAVGSVAPDFSLTSSSNTQVMLSSFSNKVVVLFFLGNSCPSCKAAAPQIESMLVSPFSKRTDYMLLGMDQWDGNAASVEAFKLSTGLSAPVLLKASELAKQYGTTYDRLVVIDKQGKISFLGMQGASADIATVKAKVEALLGDVQTAPIVGDAPAFSLSSTTGSTVSLSDYANKVRVIFFFGNQCPPCKAVAPNIENTLVTPFANRTDYVVLGLDQWNGNLTTVNAFRTSTNVTFPLLLNAASVATSYGTTYDRLLVVDKSGNIVFKGALGAANDLAAVEVKVKVLLGL